MTFASLLMATSLAIGLQLLPQTDASIDTSAFGCTLHGEVHRNGTITGDRCIRYHCNNGTWEFHQFNPVCDECSYNGGSIETYVDHLINGILTPSYQFDGSAGSYSLSQSGLNDSSQLGVNATFVYNDANEIRITNILYKQPGITVEYVHAGHNTDAEIRVNGTSIELSHNGSMTAFNSADGAVFISSDSPSWPRPIKGGNIFIVGSQGLTVAIYALHGYAWFVNVYAMPLVPLMENQLYGLCDVLPWPRFSPILPPIYPECYTMQNGSCTTNIDEFIGSWKIETELATPTFGICGIGEDECGRGTCTNTTAIGVKLPNCICLHPDPNTYCWVA